MKFEYLAKFAFKIQFQHPIPYFVKKKNYICNLDLTQSIID